MGKFYSVDLRERIVMAVDQGMSRRGAARHFSVSVSSAIRYVQRHDRVDNVAPDRKGRPRHSKLDPHRAWLLALVVEEVDVTLTEVQERLLNEREQTAAIGTLWTFYCAQGVTFQKRPRTPPSKHANMS